MRTKRILAAVLTVIMIALIPISSMADTLGWKGSDSSGWRYYTSSGSYVKNDWKKIDGNWYYFDHMGNMVSDSKYLIDGKEYNFNSSGICTNPGNPKKINGFANIVRTRNGKK